ncbi:GNAT family N-acetyltransferase [Hyalangium minutum]|uniref:Histone acetyltransferase HPA2 n=1 Tax=Hyalangium minutum TaxID=394096 RepID=A0A085WKS2_9BACT|nr:GNAT family N-acetyltransferase [Hyalangium minutum]KFE68285.1 Histone acetyltransferase HPA2 [Hyalangium minutum]
MSQGEWILRKAGLGELEEVLRLRLALMLELSEFETDSEQAAWVNVTRRYLEDALPEGRFHVWLAYVGDGAVACAGLTLFERPPAPTNLTGLEAYILNIYTEPEWRRRGISRRLLSELMEFARGLGAGRLWMHASEDGRPLYESVGFAPNPSTLEWEQPGGD